MSAYWLVLVLALGGVLTWVFFTTCRRGTQWPAWMQFGVSIFMGLSLSGLLVLLVITGLEKAFPEQIRFTDPWAECDPSYPDICISPGPSDLDCEDIEFINFRVVWPDTHHFDADGNGIGCER